MHGVGCIPSIYLRHRSSHAPQRIQLQGCAQRWFGANGARRRFLNSNNATERWSEIWPSTSCSNGSLWVLVFLFLGGLKGLT